MRDATKMYNAAINHTTCQNDSQQKMLQETHLVSYDAIFNIEEKPPTSSELYGWLAMRQF